MTPVLSALAGRTPSRFMVTVAVLLASLAPAGSGLADLAPARSGLAAPGSFRAGGGAGQERVELSILTPDGPLVPELSLHSHQGFLSFQVQELERLGWEVESAGEGEVTATWEESGVPVRIQAGNPYVHWGDEGVHLAEAPYGVSGGVYLPLQFLVDVLPWKLPERFHYDVATHTLALVDPDQDGGAGGETAPEHADPAKVRQGEEAATFPTFAVDSVRVVVIDAGHGGRDTGALGRGGTREKEIALGISRALARILSGEPNLEVYLTRDADTLIPIWKRGELATQWRGNRPGIFLSIHANAMPNSRSTQGFETYFLSEARTEDERRVAALENAAQELERAEDGPVDDPDLSSILMDLRNLDHQHWSASLAEIIQEKLSQVHPGPDRKVKQANLAVLTNALMPAALVEVGFLSNPDEERLLNQRSFQENVARSLARAVREFFRSYPPGGGGAGAP